MRIHLFEPDSWRWSPHVFGYKSQTDPRTFRRNYVEDPAQTIPIGLFVEGHTYRFWGLFEWNRHLIGPLDPQQPFYLLGADRLGRDNFSRIVYGTRVSMSIGLVGVALSLVVGLILGGISGYYGGRIDELIQRTIEFLRSMPTIPLWMGLAAAIPLTWDPLTVYFMITVLLSLIGWTSLARQTRGKVMSLKNEDFVVAARLDGVKEFKIITHQLLPAFMSHVIAVTTLAIPEMILAETALSFLGIGLRPPVVSWGVLLQEAQNVNTVATAPWLLLPGVAVVVAVLALNFLGDGLRDAADPYSHH
jgi:peptide/nickel transport system permease protein